MPNAYPDFLLLRQIAETASGMRDRSIYFIVNADGTFDWAPIPPEGPPQPTDTQWIIPITAVNDPEPRVRVARIRDEAGPEVDLMSVTVPPIGPYPGGTYPADAVFWSVSAVEKFLLPYYASVYGDEAPEIVKKVLDILDPLDRLEPDAVLPYAIAHLPSSEYTPVPTAMDTGGTARAKREFFDNMFVLRAGQAEPLTRHWRHHHAHRHGAAGGVTGAQAAEPRAAGGAGAQPGGDSSRSNGSRRRYARSAGR